MNIVCFLTQIYILRMKKLKTLLLPGLAIALTTISTQAFAAAHSTSNINVNIGGKVGVEYGHPMDKAEQKQIKKESIILQDIDAKAEEAQVI